MKLSVLAAPLISALLASTSSAWKLRSGNQEWSGVSPQGCTAVVIPRGAEISWRGSNGAETLEVFNVQGSCARVYRTVMGVGDINASNEIFGFVVKP